MKNLNEKGFTLIELMWAMLSTFIIWLVVIWTDSNIHYWFENEYSIWLSVCLTILLNVGIIIINIISELFILFTKII